MAKPTADAGAAQSFVYADLPQLVTLDGTGSSDPDGDPVTAYAWTMIDKPPGSSAALSAVNVAEPTFTADLPGTYLFHLVVTAGGEQSESDLRLADEASYAKVTVTTQHGALKLPAYKEREWHRRMNENLAALDAKVGALTAAEGDIDDLQSDVTSLQVSSGATAVALAALLPAAQRWVRKDITPDDVNAATQVVTVTAYTPPAGKLAILHDAFIMGITTWSKGAVDKTVLVRVGVAADDDALITEQEVDGAGLYGTGDKGDYLVGTDIGAGKIARATRFVGDSALAANADVRAKIDFQAGNTGDEFEAGETRIYVLVSHVDDYTVTDGATGGV